MPCLSEMKKLAFLFATITLLAACRKDMLHWQQVEKIETFTNTDRLNKIYFINDSVGFVIGGVRFDHSTILRTEDGGNTWSSTNVADAPKELFGITQIPAGDIYCIGFDGKLIKSADQGKSWNLRQLWYLPYKDLAFFDNNKGMVVGGVSFNQGYTTNIGTDGSYGQFDSVGYEMNDIEMVNAQTGFISAHGAVLRTDDSGRTWQITEVVNDNYTAIHAFGNQIWTCGYNGSIYRSSDAGKSWKRMRNGNDLTKPRYRLNDISFTDPQTGYAVGEHGLLIYTDDGGNHWMEYDRFTDNALRCVIATGGGGLLVCGDNSSLYRVFPIHLK